ncbi:tRNA (adenosine(37)-N6)-dimethylallyltransferase MiaA [Thiohalorhabdus methylotrophus]|uniref:tRNA dimethylallyltransferase n=1 Tax=Thiohalorhabdus methylotrophus TaxID=3242694 RepID=A0ABV4TYY8_9GAMM
MGGRCALFLLGATATGKTELALALADRFPVALINADSAQIYRGMDVGTAKPPPEVRKRYPHALMDFRDPNEPFSAGEYARSAREAAENAFARNRVPLLVGGTGLYFSAFARGLADLPEADPDLRARLRDEADARGWPALHERLHRLDPEAADRIDPGDAQRIQRALEVHAVTGRPITELQKESGLPPVGYPILRLGLWLPKEEIWRRVEQRFRRMLEGGLIEEARALLAAGVDPDSPAFRSVGYRQAREYLQGARDREGLLEAGVVATRRLAKRQRTWFRKEPEVEWFRPGEVEAVAERVRSFLQSRGWAGV